MIITMTPLRVSFLGGGSDYPEHFRAHGGATLGVTINKYTYLTVTPLTHFFDHRIRISYSKTELCRSVDEIQHPSVRECLRFMKIDGGVEIAVVNDLPARTGLGSSSSFTVGLLHALHAYKGEMVTQEQLGAEAVHVERDLNQERVGLQDQYLCACGGLLQLDFAGEKSVRVTPMPVPESRLRDLEERLMIFYTGLQRTAHEVLREQLARTTAGTITGSLRKLSELARQGSAILPGSGDLRPFGELLHQGWMLKRQCSDEVSNHLIDTAYDEARKAGAIGGKLLGAGGGGFLLIFAEPGDQPAVRKAMSAMREVKFHFERGGSRLIFYRL